MKFNKNNFNICIEHTVAMPTLADMTYQFYTAKYATTLWPWPCLTPLFQDVMAALNELDEDGEKPEEEPQEEEEPMEEDYEIKTPG